jgi:hypothetical protein
MRGEDFFLDATQCKVSAGTCNFNIPGMDQFFSVSSLRIQATKSLIVL